MAVNHVFTNFFCHLSTETYSKLPSLKAIGILVDKYLCTDSVSQSEDSEPTLQSPLIKEFEKFQLDQSGKLA